MANSKKTRKQPKIERQSIPIKPTRTFHIVPHSGFRKVIKVLDITQQISAEYGTDDFVSQAKQIPKTSPSDPFLTITRSPHWYSKQYIVESPSEQGQIAKWKVGAMSGSTSHLSFPSDSAHSTHPITVAVKSFWKFKEQFVQNSVSYVWRADNLWTMRQFTLSKLVGNQKLEVAKYWQGWEPFATGGTLVMNADEVDEVVGILTCLVMLRKKRQKDAERRNLAGG